MSLSKKLTWGRILGRYPDKSLKSFPPCYSQSPLRLCLEISISSNSRNLLQFLEVSYCTLYRRKEEILLENHTPLPMNKKSTHKPQVWDSQDYAQKLDIHEFGFICKRALRQVFICLRAPPHLWPHMVYLFTQGMGGGGREEPERREMGNSLQS